MPALSDGFMPNLPTLSSFVLTGFDPACLWLFFSVSALVNLTTFCPQLTVDCCPLCVVFLHSMVVHDYFCAVFCKSLIKPFIKLSRTAVLQVDPTTPVLFTIIITGALSVGTKGEQRRVLSGKCCGRRGGAKTPLLHLALLRYSWARYRSYKWSYGTLQWTDPRVDPATAHYVP